MYQNEKNKRINYGKLMLVSVIVVVMFISGFITGGSFIYGLASSDIEVRSYRAFRIWKYYN